MNIESLVRENILMLKPYTSARGDFLSGVLLDANENSFGSVAGEELDVDLNRYPDPFHNKLREELSTYLKTGKSNLFIGVGSDEIIDLLVRIFCEPRIDNTIILEPTYGMYKVVCDVNAVQTVDVMLDDSYQIDLDRTVGAITPNTKIIFVCSPNNPTANVLHIDSILQLAEKFNGIVVVDEAYSEFTNEPSLLNWVTKYPNLVVVRTFSKAWGLAGVRCGYCITSEQIISLLYKVKSPYNINKLTSDIVIQAIKNSSQKDKFVEQIKKEREFLTSELEHTEGVTKVFPSDSNFILFECNEPFIVYRRLVEKGIIIRDRSSQIKNCLRVTVGTHDENLQFLTELRKIV